MFFKEFKLPSEPVIPDFKINILDLGGKPDGKTDIKPLIDTAMTKCDEMGGGHIIIPEGKYFCDGPIHFKSNIDLHLEKNSVIKFTDEYEKYLPVVFTRIEGIRCYNYSPLIYGINLENISITGEGTLDGNAFGWWDMMDKYYTEKNQSPSDILCEMAKENVPLEERVFGTPEYAIRPYFLQFVYCKNILIEGVRFEHSPFWTVTPLFSENIIVRGITHRSEKELNGHTSYNTDSVNMDSCKNCLIENIVVESSCDDNICVKSGKDQDGLLVNIPTENVLVRNCEFSNGGGMVVVGSETSGGIKNVRFENITGHNCLMAIHVKGAQGRGNVIENVDFVNINVDRCVVGVSAGYTYPSDSGDLSKMPEIKNIYMENVTVGESLNGARFLGAPNHPIKNLVLKNMNISGHEILEQIENIENLSIENMKVIKNEFFNWRTVGGLRVR